MDRRTFMRAGALGVALLAFSRGESLVGAAPVVAGDGPYGPLGPPDELGIALPAGFRARVVARSGRWVPCSFYPWHPAPDGGACFPTPGGGWVYVSNSETLGFLGGGASAIRFDARGRITGGYRILEGTNLNCAGGPTPWGTWLSCEEFSGGQVWECDPTRPGQGVARPALGRFTHEAVAVDPVRGHLYLTEDEPDGRLWRFRPRRYPDLSSGVLEAARVDGGALSWVRVDAAVPQGSWNRPAGTTVFRGGEGCWYHDGTVYLTTKGDNTVWALDCAAQRIEAIYSPQLSPGASLSGVDNVTVSAGGDVYVAEDGGDMEIVCISREGTVSPFLRVTGQDGSELTGPAFSPAGDRLYFSSQRGTGSRLGEGGITYEVHGPFRR
jgi:sugar lactone lactonase YvrE